MISESLLNVAYVLQRFPRISETFILRELQRVREHKVNLTIYPLLPTHGTPAHQSYHDLLQHVNYVFIICAEVLKAQTHFLRKSPRNYLRALRMVFRQTWREPKLLVISLALFPKSVCYARAMQAADTNVIHAHFAWSASVAASVISQLSGIPFSIHTHAFDLFAANKKGVQARLRSASKIVTISEYNARYIRQLIPSADVEVVRCGVDVNCLMSREHQDRVPVKILSVGRLIEKKGHEYLIKACGLVARRGTAFQCRIVGAGPLRQTLLRSIQHLGLGDSVQLIGELQQEEILELYRDVDVFVLPCVVSTNGDRDGIPVALIEAMACGLPCVSTGVSGISELIEDGKNGFIVPQRNAAALAQVLEVLLSDAELRRSLGQKARTRVLQGYTLDRNVAKLAGIFRSMSDSRRHPARAAASGCAGVLPN